MEKADGIDETIKISQKIMCAEKFRCVREEGLDPKQEEIEERRGSSTQQVCSEVWGLVTCRAAMRALGARGGYRGRNPQSDPHSSPTLPWDSGPHALPRNKLPHLGNGSPQFCWTKLLWLDIPGKVHRTTPTPTPIAVCYSHLKHLDPIKLTRTNPSPWLFSPLLCCEVLLI